MKYQPNIPTDLYNKFIENLGYTPKNEKILVVRDIYTACYLSINNDVTFVSDDSEAISMFVNTVIVNPEFGTNDSYVFVNENTNIEWLNTIDWIVKNMKFDVAIMNPPYDGNLHLKILEKVIPIADKVVNISPVRWLHDPLAKYKKNSDYNKFENSIAKHIESLDIITGEKATSLFKADFVSDLGIYTIGNGDFDYINFNSNKIVDKVVSDSCKKLFDVLEQNMIKGWRVRISEMRPVPTFAPNSNVTKSFTFETTHYIHSWIYNNGYTPDGKTYWTNNNTVKGSRDKSKIGDPLPLSLYFKTQDEAVNYEKSTKTKFHRYLVLKMKTDAHFPLKYIPYMSDYTQSWTDKRFCEYFEITGYIDDEHAEPDSEWETILNTMKEYV